MNVTLQEAYDEACRALGESVVRERLLSKALQDKPADPDGNIT
jgi:hypothetical protein